MDPIETPPPAQPKITEEQAIGIARAFAKTNGDAGILFDSVYHISDATYAKEFGRAKGSGTYQVRFVKQTFADGNRHFRTGNPLPDEALVVLVNDQTGEAGQFYRL